MLSLQSGSDLELGLLPGKLGARAESGKTRWKCRSLADPRDHGTSFSEASSSRFYVKGELNLVGDAKNP
jgi:hypothetical protein